MAAAAPIAAPLSAQELDQMLAECIELRLLIARHEDVNAKLEALLPRVIAAINELQQHYAICP